MRKLIYQMWAHNFCNKQHNFCINFRIFYARATLRDFYTIPQCSIFNDGVTIVDFCASIAQTERRAWVLVKTRQKDKVTVEADWKNVYRSTSSMSVIKPLSKTENEARIARWRTIMTMRGYKLITINSKLDPTTLPILRISD